MTCPTLTEAVAPADEDDVAEEEWAAAAAALECGMPLSPPLLWAMAAGRVEAVAVVPWRRPPQRAKTRSRERE